MKQKHISKQKRPMAAENSVDLGQAASAGESTGMMPTPPRSEAERRSYCQLADSIAAGAGPRPSRASEEDPSVDPDRPEAL